MFKICLIILLLVLSVKPVHANYNQSYSDYQYLYSQYRKSFEDFTVSKATYETYKTLTTQNDALEKMRGVMTDRANIVSAYLNLILEKMQAGDGIPAVQISTYRQIVGTQDSWLSGHQKKIAAAATLSDLDDISADFDTRYPQILNETKKAVGIILVSKNDFVYSKMPDLFSRTESYSQDITNLRSLAVAKTKAQLWEGKRAEIVTLLTPKANSYNDVFDLYKAQQLMIEGLQYLKEASSFLKEIVNNLI